MPASVQIRRARTGDAALIQRLVEDAYQKYIPRIGMRPLPMDEDYAARIEHDEVWVLGEVEAVLVLVAGDGFLLIDNVAVRPDVEPRLRTCPPRVRRGARSGCRVPRTPPLHEREDDREPSTVRRDRLRGDRWRDPGRPQRRVDAEVGGM